MFLLGCVVSPRASIVKLDVVEHVAKILGTEYYTFRPLTSDLSSVYRLSVKRPRLMSLIPIASSIKQVLTCSSQGSSLSSSPNPHPLLWITSLLRRRTTQNTPQLPIISCCRYKSAEQFSQSLQHPSRTARVTARMNAYGRVISPEVVYVVLTGFRTSFFR